MSTAKVEGIPKTMRRLQRLESKIQRKVLRKAGNAAGTVGTKAIKAKAPKVNRGLSKSITKKVKTYAKSSTVVVVMGQDLRKAFSRGSNLKKRLKGGGISGRGDTVPSHLVENPTRAHTLPSRGPILNRFFAGRVAVFTQRIVHPGTRGAHFIRKAARSSQRSMARKIRNKLSIEVAAEVEKAKAIG